MYVHRNMSSSYSTSQTLGEKKRRCKCKQEWRQLAFGPQLRKWRRRGSRLFGALIEIVVLNMLFWTAYLFGKNGEIVTRRCCFSLSMVRYEVLEPALIWLEMMKWHFNCLWSRQDDFWGPTWGVKYMQVWGHEVIDTRNDNEKAWEIKN